MLQLTEKLKVWQHETCAYLFSKIFLVNFIINEQWGKCEEETGIAY